jgi:hypothetical protein
MINTSSSAGKADNLFKRTAYTTIQMNILRISVLSLSVLLASRRTSSNYDPNVLLNSKHEAAAKLLIEAPNFTIGIRDLARLNLQEHHLSALRKVPKYSLTSTAAQGKLKQLKERFSRHPELKKSIDAFEALKSKSTVDLERLIMALEAAEGQSGQVNPSPSASPRAAPQPERQSQSAPSTPRSPATGSNTVPGSTQAVRVPAQPRESVTRQPVDTTRQPQPAQQPRQAPPAVTTRQQQPAKQAIAGQQAIARGRDERQRIIKDAQDVTNRIERERQQRLNQNVSGAILVDQVKPDFDMESQAIMGLGRGDKGIPMSIVSNHAMAICNAKSASSKVLLVQYMSGRLEDPTANEKYNLIPNKVFGAGKTPGGVFLVHHLNLLPYYKVRDGSLDLKNPTLRINRMIRTQVYNQFRVAIDNQYTTLVVDLSGEVPTGLGYDLYENIYAHYSLILRNKGISEIVVVVSPERMEIKSKRQQRQDDSLSRR